MQPVERQVPQLQGLGSGTGEDGMAVLEQGVEGTAQAIVVEFVGGEIPEDVGAGPLRLGCEIDQGSGLVQPRGQQQAEDLAVGELQLRVRRQMAVDDAGDVELIE
jgi:hypothetical protein